MRISYSDEDAIKIEQVFYRLNDRNTQEGRAVRAAFVAALTACGVRLSHIERGKVHALRVFAKND